MEDICSLSLCFVLHPESGQMIRNTNSGSSVVKSSPNTMHNFDSFLYKQPQHRLSAEDETDWEKLKLWPFHFILQKLDLLCCQLLGLSCFWQKEKLLWKPNRWSAAGKKKLHFLVVLCLKKWEKIKIGENKTKLLLPLAWRSVWILNYQTFTCNKWMNKIRLYCYMVHHASKHLL